MQARVSTSARPQPLPRDSVQSCEELIRQLQHSASPAEQQKAATALSKLPMTRKVWATAVGALLPLFQLMQRSGSAAVLDLAKLAVHNITDFSQGQDCEAAATAEVIGSLIQLLQHDIETAQGLAAAVLGTLGHDARSLQLVPSRPLCIS